MRNLFVAIVVLFSGIRAMAATPPAEDVTYEAAANLDLDTSWLDPNELVKVLSYDEAHHTYEILKVEDPTLVRIFTTQVNLAKAIGRLNLELLKRSPSSVVGRTFELDHELVLEDEPVSPRSQTSAGKDSPGVRPR